MVLLSFSPSPPFPATRNRASDEARGRMSKRDFGLTSPGLEPSWGPPGRQWRAPSKPRERPERSPRGSQEESKRSHARGFSRDFVLTPPVEGPERVSKKSPRGPAGGNITRASSYIHHWGPLDPSLDPLGALSGPLQGPPVQSRRATIQQEPRGPQGRI